jgi:hypothetical protein
MRVVAAAPRQYTTLVLTRKAWLGLRSARGWNDRALPASGADAARGDSLEAQPLYGGIRGRGGEEGDQRAGQFLVG